VCVCVCVCVCVPRLNYDRISQHVLYIFIYFYCVLLVLQWQSLTQVAILDAALEVDLKMEYPR